MRQPLFTLPTATIGPTGFSGVPPRFMKTNIAADSELTDMMYRLRWEAHTGEESPEEIEAWFEGAVYDTKAAAETAAINA